MYLIIICSIISLLLIYMLRRDFLSPTFAVALCFFVAASFCVIFKDEWSVDLRGDTVAVIICGIASCFIGEFVSATVNRRKKISCNGAAFIEYKIEKYKMIMFLLLQVVVIFFYYKEVVRITGGASSSFAKMMSTYKNAIYDTSEIADNVNIVVKQFAKLSYAGTAICTGVFINNVLAKKKIIKNIIYALPLVLYVILSIIQSSRSSMLQIGMAALVMYYALWRSQSNWKKQISFNVIVKAVAILSLILILFWSLKEIVGRTSQKEFIEYIGFYFGGGIPLFDKYMADPSSKFVGYIGAETFSSLWGFLSKFTKFNVVGNLEFRYSGSIHGNTYTAFREYYNDFGWLGVIIFEFLFSFIYVKLFEKLKKTVIEKKKDYLLKTVLLAAFSYPIFYETIAAQLYRFVISVGTLTYILIIYLMYWFFIKLRIKI